MVQWVFPTKTIFREFSFAPIHAQTRVIRDEAAVNPCADMEMNVHECYEAYGIVRGHSKCAGFTEDFAECARSVKSDFRLWIMSLERKKKLLTLEKKPSELWRTKPPEDGYIFGSFIP